MNTKSKVLGLMVLGLGIMGDAWALDRLAQRRAAIQAASQRQTTQVVSTQAPTPESTLQQAAREVVQQRRVVEAITHKPTTAPPPSREESNIRGAASQRDEGSSRHLEFSRNVSKETDSQLKEQSQSPAQYAVDTQEGREAIARLNVRMFRLLNDGTMEQMQAVLLWLIEWNGKHN